MQPKNRVGMKTFVRARHDSPNETRQDNASGSKIVESSNADLKLDLPDIREAHKQSHPQDQQHARRPSDKPAFYVTDGSIDSTSTAVSEKPVDISAGRIPPVHQHHIQHQSALQSRNTLSTDEDENEDSADPSGDELDHDSQQITGKLNSGQHKLMKQHDRHTLTAKYMKGDSYPPTTDGHLSASDAGESAQGQTTQREEHQQISHRMPGGQIRQMNSSSTMRNPITQQAGYSEAQARPAAIKGGGEPTHLGQSEYMRAPAPPPVPENEFTFGKPASRGPTRQHARDPPRKGFQPPPGARLHPQSHAAENPPRNAQSLVRTNVIVEKQTSAEQRPYQPEVKRTGDQRPGFVQRPAMQSAPQLEQLPDDLGNAEDAARDDLDHDEEHSEDDFAELDYQLPELYQKHFRTLKAEKFDRTPDAQEFSFPAGQPVRTLAEKLAAVAAFNPKDQARFFTTLDISQWEEAGDWFLGRFGEVVGKLRTARQEKRRAALVFEDAIEKRHNTVNRKRKLTEEALEEMKTSGRQVLQGTPGKARRTT